MEVGCSVQGARALMAAMEQPDFGKNLPVEVKPEKDRADGDDKKHPAVVDTKPGPASSEKTKPKGKAKAKAKAKATVSKEVLTEIPDSQNLKAFKNKWVDNVSNAQGECAKLASELLDT